MTNQLPASVISPKTCEEVGSRLAKMTEAKMAAFSASVPDLVSAKCAVTAGRSQRRRRWQQGTTEPCSTPCLC